MMIRHGVAAALVCTSAVALSAQVTRPTVTGVTNFAKLDATIACAGATTNEALPELKRLGYASVINMRLANESGVDIAGSTAAATAAGLRYIHIPVNRDKPEPESIEKFLAAIAEPANQPAFVHCGSGNRVAALWMIKRMVVDGWDEDKAGKEAAELGLTNAALRKYAVDYAAARKR
jgi:uncharacterized protein (TIGR01244 family)